MKLALISFLALTFVQPGRAQSPDPASFFPDDTNVLFGIRDLSKLYDLREDHPLKHLGRHAAIQHLFGELFEDSPDFLEDEFLTDIGMSREDLAKAFPGQVTLGVRIPFDAMAAAAAKDGAMPDSEPEMVFVADCTLSEDQVADLLKGVAVSENRPDEDLLPDEPKSKTAVVRQRDDGHTIFRLEETLDDGELAEPVIHVTLTEGVFVLALTGATAEDGLGDAYFAEVVRRVDSGGREKGSIASTDAYLDAADDLEDADFISFAPLESLAGNLEEIIGAAFDGAAEQRNPVGMLATKDGVLKTLGLGDFKMITVSGTVVPDGFEMFVSLGLNGRAGLFTNLLQYGGRHIDLPDFAPEGVTGVSVTGLDISAMLNAMLEAVKNLSPMASGMLDTQLAQLEKQGLSIRDGIMGSLAPGTTVLAGFASDEIPEDRLPSQLFAFNLSDPEGMGRALAGLRAFLKKMGVPEDGRRRKFMGVPIHRMDSMTQFFGSLVDLDPGATASYAIVGNRLLIAAGEADFMEHGIASIKKKGADLLDDPGVEHAWERWGDKNMVEFAYENLATMIRSLAITTAAELEEEFEFEGQFGDEELDGDIGDAIGKHFAELPDMDDLHYYFAAKTYDAPKSLTIRIALAKKP